MEKIIRTVSNIFKERYGTQLKIERTKTEKNQPVFLSHWQSSFVYSRTLRQVSFPIFNSKRELKAIATASPVENKDAIIFDEMAQFLQLTISEHIELSDLKDMQLHREHALEKLSLNTSKVIELKTRKTESNTPSYQFKKRKLKENINFDPIWISGESENFNAHIGFSVHDWVSNWAFINAKEIPDLIWEDPKHWQNFSQVTIFIPHIESLSEANLQKLKSNLDLLKKIKSAKPLIIVSSGKELSPTLKKLRASFKHYEVKQNITARVQAHFLLFNYKENRPWTYDCKQTDQVYYLPFSQSPKSFH